MWIFNVATNLVIKKGNFIHIDNTNTSLLLAEILSAADRHICTKCLQRTTIQAIKK